jgi:hypothetical protein
MSIRDITIISVLLVRKKIALECVCSKSYPLSLVSTKQVPFFMVLVFNSQTDTIQTANSSATHNWYEDHWLLLNLRTDLWIHVTILVAVMFRCVSCECRMHDFCFDRMVPLTPLAAFIKGAHGQLQHKRRNFYWERVDFRLVHRVWLMLQVCLSSIFIRSDIEHWGRDQSLCTAIQRFWRQYQTKYILSWNL